MTTTIQDPVDHFASLSEEVRRIGEAHRHRRGIAGRVHLLIWELMTSLLKLLAGLAERARRRELCKTAPARAPDTLPQPLAVRSNARLDTESVAAADRLTAAPDARDLHVGEPDRMPEVEQLVCERVPQRAWARRARTAPESGHARAACERRRVAAMMRSACALDVGRPAFEGLFAKMGLVGRVVVRRFHFDLAIIAACRD